MAAGAPRFLIKVYQYPKLADEGRKMEDELGGVHRGSLLLYSKFRNYRSFYDSLQVVLALQLLVFFPDGSPANTPLQQND